MSGPYLWVNQPGLDWQPADITVPPVPAIPPGADPMSVLISAITPELAVAVVEGVLRTYAREQRFSANLAGARNAYQSTDGAAQEQIQAAGSMAEPAIAAGGAGSMQPGGSGAGQAGQFGQLMSMPMQMAAQAAQIPMQILGMVAAIPQGVMQGMQGAMQQVGQMSGMGGLGGQDSELEKESVSPLDSIQEEPDEDPPSDQPDSADDADRDDGASAGDTSGERVPQPDQPVSPAPTPIVPPAQTRPAELSAEIVL